MQKEIGWLLREKYNNKPTELFYKDVERFRGGEPVDYVIGFTSFLGCKINLSKKPLIPRPETEYWVERVIHELKNNKKQFKALDVFSGSGCIGISVLKNVKNSLCDFADKDKKSVEQIKINCELNKINKKKYKIFSSDIFANIKGQYDYIFANPPYIPKNKINKIQKSVFKFEPKVALLGGKDGLSYIRKFLKDANKHLNTKGRIFMEFDSPQKKEIEKLIKKYKYLNYEFHRDQYDRWRTVSITN